VQAIFELIAAIFEGLVSAIVALVSAIVYSILIVTYFLITLVTQGPRKAIEQARTRPARRPVTPEEHHDPVTGQDQTVGPIPQFPSSPWPIWISVVAVGMVIAIGISTYIINQIRAARIETAKELVNQWADDVAETVAAGNPPPPLGKLPAQDPWKAPLELFLDEMTIGTLIVIRSAGPDQKTGTIDDLLGIRMRKKPAKQLVGEIGDAIEDQLREKAMKLLKRAPEKKP